MRSVVNALFLSVLLVSSGRLLADEKYDIKSRKTAKGDVENIVEHEKTARNIRIKVGGETTSDEKQTTETGAVYRREVLEVSDKDKVTREIRLYKKGSDTKDGVTTDYKFLGKKVLIEKTADKDKPYRFSYVGGQPLTKEEAEPLDKEFNKNKDEKDDADFEKMLLPGKPVSLNETWKVDVKGILTSREQKDLEMDLDKATGSAKLVKAYRKDGRQFGAIEIHMHVPIKAIKDEIRVAMKKGTAIDMKITGDICIDGTSGAGSMKMNMKISGEGTAKLNGQDLELLLDAEETSTMSGEDVPK